MSGASDVSEEGSEDPRVFSIAGRTVDGASAVRWGLLVGALTFPAMFGGFYARVLTEAFIFAIFALAVDLLWGYTGVMTFGHAVFFGIGAYLSGKLLEGSLLGLALGSAAGYVGILASIVVTGVLGLLFAGVLFRRGIEEGYFTIITLAVAIIAEQTAISWRSVTGGFNGLTGIPAIELGIPGVWTTPLSGFLQYYVVLGVLGAVYLFSRKVIRSPFGAVLVAIDENESKARALGYDVVAYKTLVFGIASALGGLAGALYASYQGFVDPSLTGFLLSTEVLIWILVGGRGTLVGAMVGTVFLLLFENLISGIFLFSWQMFLGLLLVLIVLRYPEGLVGMTARFDVVIAPAMEGHDE